MASESEYEEGYSEVDADVPMGGKGEGKGDGKSAVKGKGAGKVGTAPKWRPSPRHAPASSLEERAPRARRASRCVR